MTGFDVQHADSGPPQFYETDGDIRFSKVVLSRPVFHLWRQYLIPLARWKGTIEITPNTPPSDEQIAEHNARLAAQ